MQVEQLALRASLQLLARAYVHHYERHGVTADFLAERVERVQQMADDYADLPRTLMQGGTQRKVPPSSEADSKCHRR